MRFNPNNQDAVVIFPLQYNHESVGTRISLALGRTEDAKQVVILDLGRSRHKTVPH